MGQYENLIFEDVLTIKKSMSKISFEYALRVGVGQGSLACCRLWGHKESDTAEWLNWTEGKFFPHYVFFISRWAYFVSFNEKNLKNVDKISGSFINL